MDIFEQKKMAEDVRNKIKKIKKKFNEFGIDGLSADDKEWFKIDKIVEEFFNGSI